jgi:hypothetical protein
MIECPEQVQHRALAGPGSAHDREKFTGFDVQV